MQSITLTETDARRMFRRCVRLSLVPLLGFALILTIATFDASLPRDAIKPLAILSLAAMVGGELYFCRYLGRLADGLGQSGTRWSHGVWIAAKFLAFVAWWLALLKIRKILNRVYAPPSVPFFPR
jgi:hypothetical protein